jgi:hypothetical protein
VNRSSFAAARFGRHAERCHRARGARAAEFHVRSVGANRSVGGPPIID